MSLTPTKIAITTALIKFMDSKGFHVGFMADGAVIVEPQKFNKKFLSMVFDYDLVALTFRDAKQNSHWIELVFYSDDKYFMNDHNIGFESFLKEFQKLKISISISDIIQNY